MLSLIHILDVYKRQLFYYRDRQSGGFGYGNRIGCKSLFRPHNWIQISNESYLLADNGEKYPIRSGNGITLGEKFWMPVLLVAYCLR